MEIKTAKAQKPQRKEQEEAIAYFRSPRAIRERCGQIFAWVNEGHSPHFTCDLQQLERVADYVISVMRCNYPDLQIPFHSRWRHFEAGNVPRLTQLETRLAELTPVEKAAAKFDLAIISVLLDAGAGESWRYYEQETQLNFSRSEGLAVASFQMFCQGTFSNENLLQVDALRLQGITAAELANGFQVNAENPLLGIDGRANLLQKLGEVLVSLPHLFGEENPRPGNLVNYLLSKSQNQQLAASTVFDAVLEGLSDIWPSRLEIARVNLGDVWEYPSLETAQSLQPSSFTFYPSLMPFHKLSQWLTYSLLEPLQELGLEITGLDALTGLPEYRNGGLCIDLGLINAKNQEIFSSSHSVASEVIVEWRALTVILLDRIAAAIREKLSMNAEELPLVKILQGGTWAAGRKIAAELRTGGKPPIQIESDGTVF